MNEKDDVLKSDLVRLVVTSGSSYIDIDVLACSLALNHLNILLGYDSISCHTGEMNSSIPEKYKLRVSKLYENTAPTSKNCKYILVDVSNPKFFEKFVVFNDIIEIYDHHFGFENFWENILGSSSTINHVGSCATLIWEKYVELNLTNKMPSLLIELIYLAVVSNTLNLKAFITTRRDRKAASDIEKMKLLEKSVIKEYYFDVESQVLKNFEKSILNDVKTHQFEDNVYLIGQIELFESNKVWNECFLSGRTAEIMKKRLCLNGEMWFVIISDISKNHNLIYTTCDKTKNVIERNFRFHFEGDSAITDRLWMRKEIIRDLK